MGRFSLLIAFALSVAPGSRAAQAAPLAAIAPGALWPADDGIHIDAHGGNILYDSAGRTYYWYGEHYGSPRGVACYSSTDLYNWKAEGVVFPRGNIAVLERPKVIYIAAARKYAMWFHYDNSGYSLAHVGVAVADGPRGPFALIDHFRPNGHQSRDLGLFVDEGKAYLLYAADSVNKTIRMVEIAADGQSLTTNDVDLNAHCEGPAMMKRDGSYYLVTSQCTGWDPNRASFYTAAKAMGPYTLRGDPCVGDTAHTTFDSQSNFIFKVPAYSDGFMFMGDRWNGKGSADARYVFLPISVPSATTMQIRWHASWDLGLFTPAALRAREERAAAPEIPLRFPRSGSPWIEYRGQARHADGALAR